MFIGTKENEGEKRRRITKDNKGEGWNQALELDENESEIEVKDSSIKIETQKHF